MEWVNESIDRLEATLRVALVEEATARAAYIAAHERVQAIDHWCEDLQGALKALRALLPGHAAEVPF